MTGGGKKKRVGHQVFLTKKGGPPKNIGSEEGGGRVIYYCVIIVEKHLTCNASSKYNSCIASKILNFNHQIDPKCNAQIPKMQRAQLIS
jgi:hypothetical protein